MKYLAGLMIFLPMFMCAQETYIDSRDQVQLWGQVSIDHFKEEPYVTWFDKYQKNYKPTIDKINSEFLSDVEVKIFVGTWCGDTKRWFPRFVKLWDTLGLSADQLSITAIHNEGEHYKNALDGSDTLYNIHRVPTFIFLKDGKEMGRIVERPINSLEQDIAQISAGLASSPRYRAVVFIDDYLEKYGIDTAYAKIKPLVRYLKRLDEGSSELNSYGYVLTGDKNIEKAEFIFRLNKASYPFEPNVHDSLGEFYFNQKRYDEAVTCFSEVIRLKGYDKNAIDYLHKIEQAKADLNDG